MTKHVLVLGLLLWSLHLTITVSAQICNSSGNGYFLIDFEGLSRGQIIDANTYAAQGIHFESLTGSNHPLVAFDTDNPVLNAINGNDGDPDLGAPNEDCSNPGPGIGAGGAPGQPGENCTPLGMILIVEENFTDNNNDGHDDVPDDKGNGASFRVTFDQPTTIGTIGFLDDIEVTVTIKYSNGSPDGSFSYNGPGDNAYGEWDINSNGTQAHSVIELEFDLVGSGGIASIETCKSFSSVGNFVWNDLNANGIQDNGEPGIAGATVNLLDENGGFLQSTTTENDGSYLFEDLDPGNYQIEFVMPTGYDTPSPTGNGTSGTDSDADPTTLKSSPFTLVVLEYNQTIDAGFYLAASLPVELVHFTGSKSKDKVTLSWATAQEANNDYFTVERSFDGTSFEAIGKIPGALFSQHVIEYEFEDHAPNHGNNYYRLRQTDTDGQYDLSEVVVVTYNLDLVNTWVGPNPFFEVLRVSQIPANGSIEIYHTSSALVYHWASAGELQLSVPTSDWEPGIYMLRITNDQGNKTIKLIKY